MIKNPVFLLIACCTLLFSFRCNRPVEEPPMPFETLTSSNPVQAGIIDEASGLADSRANPGFLWVNEDSQRPTAIHLLEKNGQYRKQLFIKNVTNRDWEELALAAGPTAGKNYIYLAETGDNDQVYPEYAFYRFEEPLASVDTVTQVDILRFRYADGSHDSEAFFVDPATKDIYVITKREAKSRIYKLTYPQSTGSVNIASFVLELPYNFVTAACFSDNGELLVKTYSDIYYYKRMAGQPVGGELFASYTKLLYNPEPQGEAIAFATDNTGFFTLSEKGFASSVNLNFYKRQ